MKKQKLCLACSFATYFFPKIVRYLVAEKIILVKWCRSKHMCFVKYDDIPRQVVFEDIFSDFKGVFPVICDTWSFVCDGNRRVQKGWIYLDTGRALRLFVRKNAVVMLWWHETTALWTLVALTCLRERISPSERPLQWNHTFSSLNTVLITNLAVANGCCSCEISPTAFVLAGDSFVYEWILTPSTFYFRWLIF